MNLRPIFLVLLCAALTACRSPGQAQTGQAQTGQTQTGQTQNSQPRIGQTRTAQTQTAQTQQTAPRQPASPRQSSTDPTSGLRWVSVSGLPTQGQQTYRLILSGGPFPYARDGVVFQNREGLLPGRDRGSYHEYTVKTPGSSDRGARRIICATVPECYYTADHYASFQRIRP